MYQSNNESIKRDKNKDHRTREVGLFDQLQNDEDDSSAEYVGFEYASDFTRKSVSAFWRIGVKEVIKEQKSRNDEPQRTEVVIVRESSDFIVNRKKTFKLDKPSKKVSSDCN